MTNRTQLIMEAVVSATVTYGEPATLGVEALSIQENRVIVRMVVLQKGKVLFADKLQYLLVGEALDFELGLRLEQPS